MLPWTIIGWLILGAIGLAGLILIVPVVLTAIAKHVMHVRTRDDLPKPGDVWIQDESALHITRVTDDGIGIQSDNASWFDSLQQWRARVRQRKLWRTKP